MSARSATHLTDADRTVIEREIRRHCLAYTGSGVHLTPPMTGLQIAQAVALAIDLYGTASEHGIDRSTADGVPLYAAAIDGIRARDRR